MKKNYKKYLTFFFFNFLILFYFSKSFGENNTNFLSLKKNEVYLRQGPSFEYPIKLIYKKKYLPIVILDKSGPWRKVKDFENKFSKYIGIKYAVGLNSCTAALHIALAVNKFKPKKKVLVPAITFSASAAAALYCGLTPVFVDVDEHNLNINQPF